MVTLSKKIYLHAQIALPLTGNRYNVILYKI